MKSTVSTLFRSKMLLSAFKQEIKLLRPVYITSRKYSDEKSIYQRNEEGPKERTVYGQPYPEWRKPWIERKGEWRTKLGLFNEKNPNVEILNALQHLPNIKFDDIKAWWASMKVIQEIQNQKFLPERVAALGANLAAVHFFTYRQGAVRLKDSKEWIAGEIPDLNFPDHFTEGFYVEAVDCTKFHHNGIRYEGLQNLTGLNFLKWLSLKDQKYIDVWCLDRLAGQNGKTLEYLDISSCKLDVGCVIALSRMSALKMLVIKDPGDDVAVQAALSYMEQEKPNLVIRVVDEDTSPMKTS